MEHLASALVIIAVLGFIALLFRWIGMGKYAELQRVFETQKQILDKFGTGPEMIQFIESKEGKEFFERLKVSPQKVSPPSQKPDSAKHLGFIFAHLWFGLVAMGGGVGFLVAFHFYAVTDFFVVACVSTGVGVGLLILSWIHYHLALKWGIIRKEKAEETGLRAS
jgi:hypothetical protein